MNFTISAPSINLSVSLLFHIGGNLMPSANITNVTGIHILSQRSALITTDFAMRVRRYKWMMCCQHFLLG
jgi:hypothetical protein